VVRYAEALATWEDLEALRVRFRSTPTWGQATSEEGGGDVSSTPGAGQQAAPGPRPKRVSKPNVRVSGPEWC
jgi:hypothetical protein